MIIFITIYPANTVVEPPVIAPASQESPIRAIDLLLTKTVLEPALITAPECETQTGGDAPFGIVCAAVGSVFRSTPKLLQKTFVEGPVTVVVASQPCPVVVASPSLVTPGIISY
jgi:hypothetical protein